MGQLGILIEQYRQSVWPEPSNVDIAKRLHVAKTSVGNWIGGTMPKPANLRALSRLIGVPYDEVLTAVLVDAGYLRRAGESGDDAKKPTTAKGRGQTGHIEPPRAASRPPIDDQPETDRPG